ncbi:MAG TPA: undecaprenyldiphospho-muramoylpentapeptide beta-N-acetylglucosaminyltransferase [Planctomycetaceae bacterium]|nr:undecaprenyldiphospho-muramoylpentapeptide beta-N-acetylglucosaminyltransferase [Planctomycetaceae bacterium]
MTDLSRVILTGGGTGGHLYPGLAVAEEIRTRCPDCEILFVGSERGLERRIIREAGFDHLSTPVMTSNDLFRAPFRFTLNYWKSRRLAQRTLREFSPQIVVGLGGFASVPVVRAAQRAEIPTLLLEQNIVPGRATRWLMKRANCVCHSFEDAARLCSPSDRQVVTGNPVRREITALLASELRVSKTPNPTILILGGSLGSVSVNRMWFAAVRKLASELASCRIFHQTGESDCRSARQTYNELGLSAISEPFFEILPTIYRQTDFVISRAGATTLAELACAGLPAILIPYPNSIGDHQVKNAQFYAARNAVRIVEESNRTDDASPALSEAIRDFLSDDLAEKRHAMRELAQPHAAANVLDQILRLIG